MASAIEGLAPQYQAQFLKIRQTFVAGLAQRLRNIAQAPNAQARYEELHRLAGAAGGYGFADLGMLARTAMQCAQDGPDAALQAALQQLADAVQAAQAAQDVP